MTAKATHTLIDGTLVPIVSGGAIGDPEGPPAAPDLMGDPAAPAPVTPPVAPTDPTIPPPSPSPDPAQPQMVPYETFQRQQRENQRYRERFQPYERAFSRVDPDVAEAFLSIAEMYAEDPDKAEEALRELYAQQPSPTPTDPNAQPITRADLESFYADRDAENQRAQQQQQNTERFKKTAEELGVEHGSPQWRYLVEVAASEFRADEFGVQRDPLTALKLAHEHTIKTLTDYGQSRIDDFVKGASTPGITPVTAGEPASGEKIPSNMDEARRAFEAAQFGPG